MDFKEWLRLDEMGRCGVPQGESFSIPGPPNENGQRGPSVQINPGMNIDMRFEDWNPGRQLGDMSPWFVKLPDGRYFINNGFFDTSIAPTPPQGGQHFPVPQQGPSKEDGKVHPWYDYMQVISGEQEVKPSIGRPIVVGAA